MRYPCTEHAGCRCPSALEHFAREMAGRAGACGTVVELARHAFASATSSAILFTGCEGCTTIATGAIAIRAIGVKSRTASYGNSLIQGGVDGVRSDGSHQQRASVGRRLGHGIGPERAAGPAAVVDDDNRLSASPSICANGRATMSVGPPAGNGTTRRICRPAIDCAAAFLGSDTKLMATALTARKATRLIKPLQTQLKYQRACTHHPGELIGKNGRPNNDLCEALLTSRFSRIRD